MKCQLWDLETGNYLETLESQEAADNAIAEYVELEGEQYRQCIGVRLVPD